MKEREFAEVKAAIQGCLQGGCAQFQDLTTCKTCGFWKEEDARRKELPMIKGQDGLRREYVGKGRYRDGATDGT